MYDENNSDSGGESEGALGMCLVASVHAWDKVR